MLSVVPVDNCKKEAAAVSGMQRPRVSFTWFVQLVLLILALFTGGAWQALASDNTILFEDASHQNSEAQYTLAHLFLKGRGGVCLDTDTAIYWFEQAAGNGHRDAAFDLAVLYLEGEKVEQDGAKALAWFTRAAELGHVEAQFALGMAYREIDLKASVSWLERAVSNGHYGARKELARVCERDTGGNR